MPKFGPADQARLAVEQANKTAEQFIRDFGRLAGIDMDQTGILINAARFPLQRDDPGSLQNLLLVCLIQIENVYGSSAPLPRAFALKTPRARARGRLLTPYPP